jgi:hypothetical protein
MFGPPSTWTYCSYLLVIGVIAANQIPAQLSRAAVYCLIVLGLLSYKTEIQQVRRLYLTMRPQPETYGLWASADEAREWQRVITIVRGSRTFLLTELGSAAITSPVFEKPLMFVLMPGHPLERELGRGILQMRHADFVVAPISSVEEVEGPSYGHVLQWHPGLRAGLAPDKLVFRGRYFVVFRSPRQS